MAKYFVGIDGGGSKTEFKCFGENGMECGHALLPGSYYEEVGIDNVIKRLQQGIAQCLPESSQDVVIGFGMPAYGEHKEMDEIAVCAIREALFPMRVYFYNDSASGWAGALAMKPGISVVGGTGSIAYGRDPFGHSERSGGWHEFFSDEGSGYWLGKRLLQLFSQQSDGRLPRTFLYDLVREELSLKEDYDITALVSKDYLYSRKSTASLQTVLLKAARAGDPYALESYDMAAEELCRIILAVINKLEFPENEPIHISFQGGLFSIIDLIRTPVAHKVCEAIKPRQVVFSEPILDPCRGVVLLVLEEFDPSELKSMLVKFSES